MIKSCLLTSLRALDWLSKTRGVMCYHGKGGYLWMVVGGKYNVVTSTEQVGVFQLVSINHVAQCPLIGTLDTKAGRFKVAYSLTELRYAGEVKDE